jgi:CubicO group peptidase (beta-lactamase class C family)
MKFYKVPSVSIAVINNGKLEWAKAYGLADLTEKRKADKNTLYQAASISKSVNALLILKLVQERKLSLNKDIREYLKSWTFPDNDLSKNKTITIKNLLNHTAGLSLHGFRGYRYNESIPAINEILDGKSPANNEAVKPIYPPNTKMEYSGGGTLITRKIIEDNIAVNYDSLIKVEILKPLGMMNSSYIEPLKAKIKNFAAAYDANMQEIEGKYNVYPELAPDGLWTTPTELSKFIISLQGSLRGKSNSLLNSTSILEMLSPDSISSGNAALGVFIKEKGGEKYFFHDGANIGYRTVYYGSFTTGRGIIIMANSDNGQIINEIINSVSTVYGWKGFYNPETRKIVNIPDTIAEKYTGTYSCSKPKMTITVKIKNKVLHLTTRGEDNLERMLFITDNRFYLPSSPNTFAEFTSSNGNTPDTLIVKENNKILFEAVKQNTSSSKVPEFSIPNDGTLKDPH